MKEIQGKLILVQVSTRFELAKVRVIDWESTVCVRGKVVIEDIQVWICCGSILFLVYISYYFILGGKMYDDEFETI